MKKRKVDEKKNQAITKGIHPVGLPFTLSGYHSPSRATIHPLGLQFTPSGYNSPHRATIHLVRLQFIHCWTTFQPKAYIRDERHQG